MLVMDLLIWTVLGLLGGFILTLDENTLHEHPILTTALCLYLGPFWWMVLLILIKRMRGGTADA